MIRASHSYIIPFGSILLPSVWFFASQAAGPEQGSLSDPGALIANVERTRELAGQAKQV